MRNLKRALSLLLSSTMVLGMLVMGSSAASYQDVKTSHNTEAIEVLQAVGIMTGDQNGKFNPDAKVTRNEMAVIMCNLLDYTVASYKGTAPFTDVPAWAEPYVAACYTNGITAGISATQYGGNQTVTTGEAALMLLKALGYFQYSGDFGQDWLVETTKTGSTAGLFGGVKNGAREALTRNDVAQMVLNTLKADVVVAEKNGSDITVGDIIISGGKATYTARVSTDSDYKAISDAKVDGKYTVQLGEELYDGKLVKAGSAEDDFGRPSVKWTYKSQEVGVYSDKAEAVYTASVEKQDLYDLIGSEVYNDLKNNKADFSVYVDGNLQKDAKLSDYIVKNSSTDIKNAQKGATTEVFVDDDNNVVITVINTYVAQVDGDYDKDDKELDLTTVNDDKKFPSVKNMTLSADDFDYLNAYSDEDYVLVTVAGDEIKTIEKAETVTGTMDAYTKDKSITVDNTKYEYSKNYAGEIKEPELGEKYVVVLDANGYVVYTDGVEASDNYVYVASMDNTSGVKKNLEADAYFADGTNKVIVVDNDDDFAAAKDKKKGWYTYDEKNNGKYKLEFVTYQYNGTKSSGNIIEKGKVAVNNGNGQYSANTATTFVVNDDDKITVYNGIKNVPTIKAGDDTTVSVLMKDKDSKYADMVYISGKSLSISGDSGDRVYILDTSSSAKKDADGNKYYVYDAIVNGKVTTVNALEYKLPVGLYEANYDKNGYMRNDKAVDSKTGDFRKLTISQAEYADGVLTLGNTPYVLADDYKIFVNDDGDAKTVSASKLADKFAEYKDTVYLYMNDDDQVVEVYVMAKAETEKPKEPEVTGYKVVKTNAGDITVTLDKNQVKIDYAKVVDSNDKNYNYGKATLKFKVEVRDGGYQEEVTFTAPASTANTGEYAGCMIDGTFKLPYELAAGTYRVTVTVSNDTIGELTIGSTTATVQ
ncbi:MAG: S-layer homology domain-containing protein [Flintibacter sp.]|uniref:S-layer homology domain-containing protein n=1 Tax=Flintibacter sp. TaxID=1918624 RepID=UPI002672E3B1|nr:S-layer homology domain-containing protein [Flintibacter sp.]MCI6150648.1 S-layer homology domain-containing protein [Flintibacter sp.]MDY5038707.1 S-layer homology domain-containing protein [Lawsonibacter sp.]